MRYYKQFHGWSFLYLIALAIGVVCLFFAIFVASFNDRITLLACGLVGLILAWVLWKGRKHYLDVTNDRITHHGFKHWTLRKSEVTHVEPGRKGWGNDYDLCLKIHAGGKEYTVDGGFLINEKRVEEITNAIRSRPLA